MLEEITGLGRPDQLRAGRIGRRGAGAGQDDEGRGQIETRGKGVHPTVLADPLAKRNGNSAPKRFMRPPGEAAVHLKANPS